jgi:hypothetical protein
VGDLEKSKIWENEKTGVGLKTLYRGRKGMQRSPLSNFSNTHNIMGNLKKKRRLKMSKHKRRKRLKSNRHKKRTWQK